MDPWRRNVMRASEAHAQRSGMVRHPEADAFVQCSRWLVGLVDVKGADMSSQGLRLRSVRRNVSSASTFEVIRLDSH